MQVRFLQGTHPFSGSPFVCAPYGLSGPLLARVDAFLVTFVSADPHFLIAIVARVTEAWLASLIEPKSLTATNTPPLAHSLFTPSASTGTPLS